LDDARVGVDRVIGEVDAGWAVAITTLAHERAGISQGTARGLIPAVPGTRAGMLERTVAEIIEAHGHRDGPAVSGFVMSPRFLIGLARERNLGIDPLLRQRLARFYCMAEVHRLNGLRARGSASRGQGPGPAASTAKLALAELARTSRDLGLSILGASGMLADHDAPLDGAVLNVALSSFAAALGGGTDEIQRNTIGERVLGLPKEPQVDRDIPFRDLLVGTQRAAS
jgi:alkylation response protein AidB-like acyl-CoA dehydrogenase